MSWFASDGEPPLYYTTESVELDGLESAIGTVIAEMQRHTERDEVDPGAQLLMITNGTNSRLSLLWFHPSSKAHAGRWRYSVVARELGAALGDANEFERQCGEALMHAVSTLPLGVHYRFELVPEVHCLQEPV